MSTAESDTLEGAPEVELTSTSLPAEPRHFELTLLLRFRATTLVSDFLTVAFARFSMGMSVTATMGVLIALKALSTGLLAWARRRLAPHHKAAAAAVLIADSALFALLLGVSGGATNPFSAMFLVYVVVAALVLDARWGWLLAALGAAGFGALFWLDDAGPPAMSAHHAGHHDHVQSFRGHLQGMYVAYVVAAAIAGSVIAQLLRELAARQDEVARLVRRAERADRSVALHQVAAGTAHELGTPLGTIALVAREIETRTLDGDARLHHDAKLLRQESERCRRILGKLSESTGAMPGEAPRRVEEADLWALLRERLDERADGRVEYSAQGNVAVLAPPMSLAQVVASLVTNALDASPAGSVTVSARDAGGVALVTVRDGGCGMDASTLAHLGEPMAPGRHGASGMGLGLTLATSFARSVGGSLVVRSRVGEGTVVELRVPLAERQTEAAP